MIDTVKLTDEFWGSIDDNYPSKTLEQIDDIILKLYGLRCISLMSYSYKIIDNDKFVIFCLSHPEAIDNEN